MEFLLHLHLRLGLVLKMNGNYSLKLLLLISYSSIAGFAANARNESRLQMVGKFQKTSNANFLNCGLRFQSMAYQIDDSPKTNVNLMWQKSDDHPKGKAVIVYVAVVKSPKERYLLSKTITP